jgi:soluble lytic murein transglycosylase-like protein
MNNKNDKLVNELIKNGLLDMNTKQLIILAGFGLMVYQINRNKAEAMELPPALDRFPVRDYLPSELAFPGYTPATVWQTPSRGLKYEDWFVKASNIYGLPPGLLSRVAKQESNYDPNVVSHAGAVGLMQIVPKWHPTANPLDPRDSIFYAAKYLEKLKRQTGSWILALAAYNWGIGNLQRKGIDAAPKETQNYIAYISRDIQLT